MKQKPPVTIRIRHISSQAAQKTVAFVRDKILELGRLRKIDAAHVSFEQERERAPGFRVHVHLETPGPDLHAEGRDHTLLAAALRTLAELHRHVRVREAKRRGRREDRSTKHRTTLHRMVAVRAG